MNYENKEKLSRVLTEIVNSENQSIVDENKKLAEWKRENLPKLKKIEEMERVILSMQNNSVRLTENIQVFMTWIWATFHDESWADGNNETWESWGEDIRYWKYKNKLYLLLTNPYKYVYSQPYKILLSHLPLYYLNDLSYKTGSDKK